MAGGGALATTMSRVESTTRALLSCAIAVVIAYAFGAFDSLGNSLLAAYITDALGANATVGSLVASVFSGTVEARNLRVDEFERFPGGDRCLEVGSAVIHFDAAALCKRRVLVVTRAVLRDVRVVVSRRRDGAVNFGLADKRRRKSFYDAHPPGATSEPGSPTAESADDGFVVVVGDAPAPAPDFFDRAGEPPSKFEDAEPVLETGARALWGLLGRGVARARDYEASLEKKGRRRSAAEDLALEALAATREAAGAVAATADRAAARARDVLRATLLSAVDDALPDADEPPRASAIIDLRFAGPVRVEDLTLELVGPDGAALLAPPLRFAARDVDATSSPPSDGGGGGGPPSALRRVLRIALRGCVDDLLADRPEDAKRVAAALASLAVGDVKREGRAALRKHFPRTTEALQVEPRPTEP